MVEVVLCRTHCLVLKRSVQFVDKLPQFEEGYVLCLCSLFSTSVLSMIFACTDIRCRNASQCLVIFK